MAAWRTLPWLVGTVALFACAAAAADTDGSLSADTLAKVLAGVIYVKELGNIDNAKHAMTLFTNVADAHIGEVAAKGQNFQVVPTDANNGGSNGGINGIFNHGDPKFEYFLDPTQNPAADFFGFLKPNNTFIGTSAGPNVITYAPCFASVAPSGVNVAAIGVNFIPSLLSVFPAGIGIAPQGVNIQPSLVYISPYGVNVSPQGFNVQPQLIAVTPIDYSYVPQGYNYAPALISVGGRKLAAFDGKAAARKLQSVGTAPIRTPKIPTTDDQAEFFAQSYGNWVTHAVALIMGREGGNADNAQSFLSHTMSRTDHYLNLLHNDTLGSLSQFLPQPPVFNAPQFFSDQSANISSTTNGFVLFSSLINWAPCAVQIAPVGVGVAPIGLNVQPGGIFVQPQGINVQPQGLNIQPTLIFISPIGRSYTPQGGNISPTLIAISPVATSINPQGKSCAATLIAIDKDGNVTFNDYGGCNGEGGTSTAASSDVEGGTEAGAAGR